MEPLAGIVSRLLPAPSWAERLKAARILSRWEEIVGNFLGEATRPRGFSRGTLILEVPDTLWIHQLRFGERNILRRLNEVAGEELFRQIRFVLSRKRTVSREKPKETIPEKALQERASRDVASIEDPELKEAFRRLRLTLLRKVQRAASPRRCRGRRGFGR